MEERLEKEKIFSDAIEELKENFNVLSKELETLRKEKEIIKSYAYANESISILETLIKEKEVIGHYYDLFDNIGVSLGEFDIEKVRTENKRLKDKGIQIEEYFKDPNNLIKHENLIRLTRVNIETVKLFEAENNEQIIKNVNKIITEKTLKGLKEEHIAFFNEEAYYECENTYNTLKGNEIIVLEKIYFPSELTNVAVVSFTDITKRKMLENELKSSEEKYKFLFNNVPIMILDYDLSEIKKYYDSLNLKNLEEYKELMMTRDTGVLNETFKRLRIADVNDTIVKLLKAPNKKDIIENFGKYYTHRTFNDFLENVILVFSGALENHFETDFVTADGKMLNALVTWKIVTGYEESYSKIYIIIVDITKEKVLESIKEKLHGIM